MNGKWYGLARILAVLVLIITIPLLLLLSPACGGSEDVDTVSPPETETVNTATKTAPPGLAQAGSWSSDNLNHQEPMVVEGVTSSSPQTLFVALIASDSGQGPAQGGPPIDGKILSVTGGGLTWTLQVEAHLSTTGEPGITEVWTAFADSSIAPFTVTVARSNDTGANTNCDNYYGGSGPDICNGMVYIMAVTGTDPQDPIGAIAANGAGPISGKPGSASVTLISTRKGSWVFAVGSDWSDTTRRVLPAGQVMVHEDMSSPNGDSYWVQQLGNAVDTPGPVTLADTASDGHDTNMVAVEIMPQL